MIVVVVLALTVVAIAMPMPMLLLWLLQSHGGGVLRRLQRGRGNGRVHGGVRTGHRGRRGSRVQLRLALLLLVLVLLMMMRLCVFAVVAGAVR